jgi:hypothetical protein
MREGSDRTRGVTGPRREGRRNAGSISFTATYCNRSCFSSWTLRAPHDRRSDYEAEPSGGTGRMRSKAECEDDEPAYTTD